MSVVELSFIAIGAIGVLGVIGIVAIVTGRGPGNIDWKKNIDKRAVKAEKSKEKTSFFAPSKPKSVEEVNIEEVIEVGSIEEEHEETDGSIKIEEKVVYEEISEEERYIKRKQFLGKALGGTFGAFMGIQALAWLGFLWPKVSGGFGSKVDAGKIEDLKNQSHAQLFPYAFLLLFLRDQNKELALISFVFVLIIDLSSDCLKYSYL